MCLYLSKTSKEKVAKKDILVWKVLCRSHYYTEYLYYTPIRLYEIKFNKKNYCIVRSKIEQHTISILDSFNQNLILLGKSPSKRVIDKAIHAFRYRCGAENYGIGHVHYAIIPKGTKYYTGIYNEIATSKLIIFKTEQDYLNYKNKQSSV